MIGVVVMVVMLVMVEFSLMSVEGILCFFRIMERSGSLRLMVIFIVVIDVVVVMKDGYWMFLWFCEFFCMGNFIKVLNFFVDEFVVVYVIERNW